MLTSDGLTFGPAIGSPSDHPLVSLWVIHVLPHGQYMGFSFSKLGPQPRSTIESDNARPSMGLALWRTMPVNLKACCPIWATSHPRKLEHEDLGTPTRGRGATRALQGSFVLTQLDLIKESLKSY